jgi:WD40 repeat protein
MNLLKGFPTYFSFLILKKVFKNCNANSFSLFCVSLKLFIIRVLRSVFAIIVCSTIGILNLSSCNYANLPDSTKHREDPKITQALAKQTILTALSQRIFDLNKYQKVETNQLPIISIKAIKLIKGSDKQVNGLILLDKLGNVTIREQTPNSQTAIVLRRQSKYSLNAQFALSNNGNILAIADLGKIWLVDLHTGSTLLDIASVRSRVLHMEFDHKNQALLIAAADSNVYRWLFVKQLDCRSLSECSRMLERYNGHATIVSKASFHPSDKVLFSVDWEGVCNVWKTYDSDQFSGEYDQNIFAQRFFSEKTISEKLKRADTKALKSMSISSDGNFLVLGSQEGILEIWKIRGLQKIVRIKAHQSAIELLDFSPEGHLVLSSDKNDFKIWSLAELLNKEKKDKEEPVEEVLKVSPLSQVNSYGGVSASLFISSQDLFLGSREGKLFRINLQEFFNEN